MTDEVKETVYDMLNSADFNGFWSAGDPPLSTMTDGDIAADMIEKTGLVYEVEEVAPYVAAWRAEKKLRTQ